MKKLLLALALLPMTASFAANAAVKDASFASNMAEQKEQLRPQQFNFHSDRYMQVQAQAGKPVAVLSFKKQLDSQKDMLRHHQFSPISDAYFQTTSRQH